MNAKKNDLKTIMVLGSGPIKIGQAAEFDFSGSQAVRALREDGYEVILLIRIQQPFKMILKWQIKSTLNRCYRLQ